MVKLRRKGGGGTNMHKERSVKDSQRWRYDRRCPEGTMCTLLQLGFSWVGPSPSPAPSRKVVVKATMGSKPVILFPHVYWG